MSHDSRSGIMYVFPGQGSQYLGMGSDIFREFACARAVYERASACMGFDVARLSFEGPEVRLNGTEFTQIALLTHSIACLEVFRELTGDRWPPAVAAGHSLGEYSALVAAGALGLEDALRLIRMRGRLMSQYGRGQMVAFRLDLESIKPLADAHYCGIGGCNLPDQTVVCGFESDLEALTADVAAQYGRARAGRYLKTEGAFHTYLMIGAAERFRPYLDVAPLRPPACRVVSNYTGDYHAGDPECIRAALFFQMFHPVKWMSGLQRVIADGVEVVVELGGGIGRDAGGAPCAPASRKPNLEGITRKAFGGAGRKLLYLPAINRETLTRAACSLDVIEAATSTASSGADAGPGRAEAGWLEERRYRLYLPIGEGVASEEAVALGVLVRELGVANIVRTFVEAEHDSLHVLRCCCDPGIGAAEPYLEILVGGGTGAFLHYRGEDIRRELVALRDRLVPRQVVDGGVAAHGMVESA